VSPRANIDVASLRLRAQGISGTRPRSAREVVQQLGAVQAQDYAGGLWAVGLRSRGARVQDVEAALRDGTVVRTWPLRGTLHFAAPADVRWMLDLSRKRQIARSALRNRQLELNDETFAASRKLFERALRGGRQLTREEAYTLLDAGGVSPSGQRGIHILWRMAHDGVLCFGPPQGKKQTFVLLDEWVPAGKALPREEALAELALRYFPGHGPATLADFTWWSGLAPAEAKTALEAARERLECVMIGGAEHWMGRGVRVVENAAREAFLLPPFDEYLVGYKDRAAAVAPQHVRNIANMLSPTIVIHGRVAATWTRVVKKDTVAVSVKPFSPFAIAENKLLQEALRRYGEFLGLEARLAEGS
jgi:hypothetical protein